VFSYSILVCAVGLYFARVPVIQVLIFPPNPLPSGRGLCGQCFRPQSNTSGTWIVVAMHDNHDDLKFPLSGGLTRDQAIASASHHVRAVTDPEPRDLTATELRKLAIVASNSTTVTDVANVAIEYLRLSAQNPNLPHSFLERPEMREIIVKALFHCWKNSPLAKGYMDSEEEREAIAAYIDARDFVTVSTFVEAFDDFKSERNRGLGSWRIERPEPQPLTPKQIEEMSDEEIEANLAEARRLHREGKLQD
jgi:hypothetical protein